MGGALYAVNLTRRFDKIIPTNTAASRPASFALWPQIGLRPGGTRGTISVCGCRYISRPIGRRINSAMQKGRKTMLLTSIAALLFIAAVALLSSTDNLAQFGARPSGIRLERIKRSPNFDGQSFVNPVPTNVGGHSGGFFTMLRRWLLGGQVREPRFEIPVDFREAEDYDLPPPGGLRLTWMGHSSVLIEIDSYRVLTDPVWSERVSPFSFLGPRRFHAPPIALTDLPPLDAVIISHDHYDHLDRNTVIALAAKGIVFVMPLGVGAHLEKWGVADSQIVELDWWDSWNPTTSLAIAAAPGRHFSGRLGSRNPTLWASWAVIGPNHRVFFSGDTGPYDGFDQIGGRYGPFDATLIKIGAYDQAWPEIHLNPPQAVAAHVQLGGGLMLPIHWGTFNLAFHDWFEPPQWVLEATAEADVPVALPRPGQLVDPAAPPAVERWWLGEGDS